MHNLCEDIMKLTTDSKKAKEFFMAELAFNISPARLKDMLKNNLNDIKITDVREYDDYIEEHIPYAIHIPLEELSEHMEHFDKDKINIFYGYSPICERGKKAALLLADKDYPVKNLLGGFKGWLKSGYDIIKEDKE